MGLVDPCRSWEGGGDAREQGLLRVTQSGHIGGIFPIQDGPPSLHIGWAWGRTFPRESRGREAISEGQAAIFHALIR